MAQASAKVYEVFSTKDHKMISWASFYCNKIVGNLHLFLAKVAVKNCIYWLLSSIDQWFSNFLQTGRTFNTNTAGAPCN